MLYLYLAALIIGAGTILLQIVLASAGHGGDVHDFDGHGHDVAHDHDASTWSIFLSSRFWTFLLLAFGLVGSALAVFGLAGTLLTAVLAIVSGILAGLLAALTFRALKRSQATGTASLDDAVGQIGRVLLPCEKGKIGKIRLSIKGQSVDVMAMTTDESIDVGRRAVVQEVRGGIAQVTRTPEELDE